MQHWHHSCTFFFDLFIEPMHSHSTHTVVLRALLLPCACAEPLPVVTGACRTPCACKAGTSLRHPRSLLPAPEALWSLPPAARLPSEAVVRAHCLRTFAAASAHADQCTSQAHGSNICGACRLRHCFSGACLARSPGARNCLRVGRCVEAPASGRRACTPTSPRWARAFRLASCFVQGVLWLRTSLAVFCPAVFL